MHLSIKNQENFWAGVMFAVVGVIAIYVARDYPMGTAMRMGPGYFPFYLGSLLILLGVIISLLSFRIPGGRIRPFAWRPMFLITLAFVTFGLAIDTLGLVIALAVLIFLSALAGRDFKIKEVVILMVVLIVGAWAIFVYGLELPFPLWWWR